MTMSTVSGQSDQRLLVWCLSRLARDMLLQRWNTPMTANPVMLTRCRTSGTTTPPPAGRWLIGRLVRWGSFPLAGLVFLCCVGLPVDGGEAGRSETQPALVASGDEFRARLPVFVAMPDPGRGEARPSGSRPPAGWPTHHPAADGWGRVQRFVRLLR